MAVVGVLLLGAACCILGVVAEYVHPVAAYVLLAVVLMAIGWFGAPRRPRPTPPPVSSVRLTKTTHIPVVQTRSGL